MSRRRRCGAKPAQQGTLDGLCGVYAVINSIRIALRVGSFTTSEAEDLYRFLLAEAGRRKWLASLIFTGTSVPEMSRLLRYAQRWLGSRKGLALSYRKPFHRSKNARLSTIIEAIGTHLSNASSAAILGTDGVYGGHWTVARAVTPKCIHLADSDGWKRIVKAQITSRITCLNSDRLVFLSPPCVFLIRVQKSSE